MTQPRGRTISGTTLLLFLPLIPLTLFGVARAAAPVSILGVLLDDPWTYIVVAAVVVVAGALLMALRPVETVAARLLFGMRDATADERERVEPLLEQACGRAGIDRRRLMLRMEDSSAINAYASAGHLVCVTTGAMRLPGPQLEAVLGHELGHHAELHPLISSLTWWLQLPSVPLRALLRGLRRLIANTAARFGGIAKPIGVVLLALLWIVTFQVLWLVWVADVLAAFVSRRTEFAADARAVSFGYGPDLLDAYATLGAPGGEDKTRWQRLTDYHPPMQERIGRIEERLAQAPGAYSLR